MPKNRLQAIAQSKQMMTVIIGASLRDNELTIYKCIYF